MKMVIARSPEKQSTEIASLCPEHHAVQGFARKDCLNGYSYDGDRNFKKQISPFSITEPGLGT